MPLGILLVFILLVSSITFLSIPKKQIGFLKRNSSAFDSNKGNFLDNRGYGQEFLSGSIIYDPDKDKREAIETSLIRTCRTISTIAHANGCADWNKASSVWKYVGSAGGIGTLDDAMTGSVSAAFSCTKMDQFGRNLLQNAVPSSYVVGLGYLYDFTGMSDDNSDPCGYIDIVRG